MRRTDDAPAHGFPEAAADGLFAHDAGDGPVVVCLHSSTGTHAQWRGLAQALAPQWRVLSLDFHGHGRSPAWPAGEPGRLNVDALAVAQRVDALAGRAAAQGVHLVAHSYGAAVALQLALRWPHWVRSLTLYEPVPFGVIQRLAPGDATLADIRHIAEATAAHVARGEADAAASGFIDYWSGAGTWAAMAPAQQATVRARIGTVARHFEALFAATWGRDTLARLRMPMLLMCGTRTRSPARRLASLFAQALPQLQRADIDGAGHLGPITHAAAVIGRTVAHLDAVRASSWSEVAQAA